MNDVLRIGFIGAGGMGLHHAKNIHSYSSEADVTGVYEPNDKSVSSALEILKKASRFNDPFELINSDKIDAVVICSPDATHASLVLACLDARKPVLCEKPLATNVEDLKKILSKENECGKKYVSVGFNRRFDPYHLAVKKVVDSEEIGLPLLWKGVHRNAAAMYDTSGAFILNNSAGHDVDSARWLLGSDVKTIQAKGIRSRKELPDDAQDLLFLQMEMMNGTLAVGEVYVNVDYGYEVIAELVCQKGTATSGHADKTVVRSKNNRGTYMSSDFRGYFIEAYLAEMTDWIESVKNDRIFRGANAWDGYEAVVVTLAGAVSLKENRMMLITTIDKPKLYR
jgi:myo-inositol 2-dehydrogenase/D-chiro-inositol 1-dehydrogenase